MPDVPFRLEDLSGHWEGRGRDASTYDLWVDFPQQTSMTVHTTRPRGGAICTRGLITLDNQPRGRAPLNWPLNYSAAPGPGAGRREQSQRGPVQVSLGSR